MTADPRSGDRTGTPVPGADRASSDPGRGAAPPLRVERIVAREIRIPLVRPFEIASGATAERRVLLLELVHPDGPRVWAECVAGEAPDYSEETVDTARIALRRWLAPRLEGRELSHPAEAWDVVSRGVRGHRMAKAALEMGTWALHALLLGRPLARVLAGRRRSRTRVPTGVTLGLELSREEAVEEATRAREAGYRKVKAKIAPGRDRGRLRALRDALGEEAPLVADANGAYPRGRADLLPPADELGLAALEQPFEGGDLLAHAALQRRFRTPVALDESVTSFARGEDMVHLESGRALNLKPGRVGGFAPSLALHALCRRVGVALWCGGMLETGLGRAYNAALASLPGFGLPGELYPPQRYLAEDVVRPAPTVAGDGTVAVPGVGANPAAGTGVEVDRDRVEDRTVWREQM